MCGTDWFGLFSGGDLVNQINGNLKLFQLFITVHFNDSVRKSLLIDERMDCLDVCQSLAEKSETKLTPDCTVVEYLPELNIGK